jgi:hypothetical protein
LKVLGFALLLIVPSYVFFSRFAPSTNRSQTDTTLASEKFNSQDDSLNFGFGEEMIDYNELTHTPGGGNKNGRPDNTENDKHTRLVTESSVLDFSTPSVLYSAEEMTTDYHGRSGVNEATDETDE